MELSVVILIIGVLIAGVLQGSKMLTKFRLQTARSLTRSSPVIGIKDLALWLETTSEASFIESQAVNGTQLTLWNDINPQNTTPFFARKTASNSAKYVENSTIGGLPTIYLDGSVSGQFLLSTVSTSAVATPAPVEDDFSFFIVAKTNFPALSSWSYILANGVDGTNGFSYSVAPSGTKSITVHGSHDPSGGTTPTSSEIFSYTYAGGILGEHRMYSNGVYAALSNTNVTYTQPTTRFLIGARGTNSNAWTGWISEIIMYNKYLDNEERKSVEKYLSQKYGIAITQ